MTSNKQLDESDGKRIKRALLDRDRSQRWLARQAHIDETTLSKIVNDRVRPNAREQKAIARVLQLPPEDLFAGSEVVTP